MRKLKACSQLLMLSIAVVFWLFPSVAHAQGCHTSSLTINTGYNPATGTIITGGADGATPVPDAKWIVTAIAASTSAGITARGGLTEVTIGANADVIATLTDWIPSPTGVASGYISCFNGQWYWLDGTGPCPAGTDYYMTFGRPFTMCFSDSIKIDLYIANDNYISASDIDGVPLAFSQACSDSSKNYSTFIHFVQTVYLTCGVHELHFTTHNFNYNISVPGNAAGMNAYGTLSSPSGGYSLLSEAAACTTSTCSMPPIIGSDSICVGQSVVMSDSIIGGTWSTSLPGVATIGSTTGILTGTGVGTVTVTYSFCGIYTIYNVSVYPSSPITGVTSVCVGRTTTLSDAYPSGTWSSSTPGVATISSGGVVTGVSPGTTIISYTLYCTETTTVTVYPMPAAITGPSRVCAGSTITLSDATPGGIWSSYNISILTVGSTSGIVTPVTGSGGTIISYTTPGGCYVTDTIFIDPLPSVITGGVPICPGSTTSLSDASPGGTWSSGSPGIATVGSTSGIVTGVSGGTSVITYMLPTGCYRTKTVTITAPPTPIIGPTGLCRWSSITLSDATPGGTWSSSAPGIAPVGMLTGIVTNPSGTLGTAVITYRSTTTGCYVTTTITVNPLPDAITGPSSVCVGSTISLSDAGGGTWSSSVPGIATVGSTTGVVTGVSPGGAIITYTLPTGCYVTMGISVLSLPSPITGTAVVCVGATTNFSDVTAGGTWISSAPGTADVDASTGVITGMVVGTAVITYQLMSTSCYVTKTVTVMDVPALTPITGIDSLCPGTTTTFSDSYAGGTWYSGDVGIATIDPATGVISGVSAGIATISYVASNLCGFSVVTKTVRVLGPPVVPPIYGILGVCEGMTTTLYNDYPGGVWTSASPAIATVDPATGVVTGVATGTAVISYMVTGICDSTLVTTIVRVNMLPFITTNFRAACGDSLSGPLAPIYVLSDTDCIVVCDSTVVRYYGNGNAGSVYTWDVIGGIVIADYGDSIDVMWPVADITGTIHIFDTAGSCYGEASACIRVIKKPNAYFWQSADSICLDDIIVFRDSSVGSSLSPIVSWLWDFGDGGFAAVADPTHSFTAAGTFTVKLIVRNACGCPDTFSRVVVVSSTPGPVIECASIVCEDELATYTTPAGCGTYNWSVRGGTIVSGLGTTSIVVKWDNVDADGFGYVSLAEPCAGCPYPTTIKIPVILQHAVIVGADTVCTDQQYEYSIPLWAATQYRWGLLGYPWEIVGGRTDHKVTVSFSVPGTYTIHAWYQNRIKLCGGNEFKTIVVLPATGISGNTIVCMNNTETYTISDAGISGSWTLSEAATGAVVATGSGNSTSFTFGAPTFAPGVYILSTTGGFCANPIAIKVIESPDVVDSVTGPDTVCLNRVYTYTAFSPIPGTTYTWSVTGGTITPASGSDVVTVIWTSTGTKQLSVSRISTTAPFCSGPPLVTAITEEVINPVVTGDTTPCANSYGMYDCIYARGEMYEWTIYPNTAGSVTAGSHTSLSTVLWNNVTTATAAMVIVSVQKCDSTYFDTLNVIISPSFISLNSSTTSACPLDSVTFTATPGAASYVWDFGDGTGTVTTVSNVIKHPFPINTTTGNINYHIQVTGIPGISFSCPVAGTAHINVDILPGPVAYASDAAIPHCPPLTIVGTVTTNVTGLTYQWYDDSGPITGETNVTYNATAEGNYYFIVTASNGCSGKSNLDQVFCGGVVCEVGVPASSSHNCMTITLTGSAGISTQWHADTPPVGGSMAPGTIATAIYDVPGIYQFKYVIDSIDTCLYAHRLADTIPVVPNFRYRVRCAASGMDSIFLSDYTAYLPFYTITGIAWTDLTTGGAIPAVANPIILRAAPGSYNIRLSVTYTGPGDTVTCDKTITIALPGPPHASFTDTLSPICEGVPIHFTNHSIGGIVRHEWDFGDFSGILLPDPDRTYKWGSGAPELFIVLLTVTDSIGCTDDTTNIVGIYQNDLNGNLGSDQVVCADAAPVTITWTGTGIPVSYLWSNGSTTVVPSLSVSESGSYWVTLTDANQCQKTIPVTAVRINIIRTPDATITGRNYYCDGDIVHLDGQPRTGVSYEWFRNGTSIAITPSIDDAGLTVGDYEYQLVIGALDTPSGITCYDTSALDTVHIMALPPRPTLSGPVVLDCNSYHLQLTASEPMPGTFNWSDGNYGPVDDIYAGGFYRVWFTDMNGCKNRKDTTLPMAPSTYFPYFPVGCYTLCEQQLPLTLYGPPGVAFDYWGWLMNSSTVLSGTGAMSSYDIAAVGSYQWELGNGLCTQTSGAMDVSLIDCGNCQGDSLVASIVCNTVTPSSYDITITLYSPGVGCTYTLGTDIGPITPFSGTLPTFGVQPPMTLTFTTLSTPPPSTVVIQVQFTLADGTKCFRKDTVSLPSCTWIAERRAYEDTTQGDSKPKMHTALTNAMLVFPNPSSGDVTVSYDYGTDSYKERSLSVFDVAGRKIMSTNVSEVHGNWHFNSKDLVPGMYVINMEADGNTLQVQRLVVIH